jgi:hypothetical protein
MTRLILRFAPLLVLAGVLLYPSQAEARRGGIVLITTGDTVKHVGDIKPELKPDPKEDPDVPADLKVGYIHDRFGIFWLDLWTWNGRYCVYNDEGYDDITEEDAAFLTGGSVGIPIFYRIPPGLLIIVAIAVIWAVVAWRNSAKQKAFTDKIEGLLEDGRYKRALEILQEYYGEKEEQAPQEAAETPSGFPDVTQPGAQPAAVEEDDDVGYQKAVQHLVDNGIPREEAEENLGTLIAVLTHAGEE